MVITRVCWLVMVRSFVALVVMSRTLTVRFSWSPVQMFSVRSNNSIIEEFQPTCRFLAEVKRRKLQYFGHVVRADNLCTHIRHGIIAGNRRRGRPRRRWTDDIKRWIGQEYLLQIVFNVQETEACGDPWCPCRWPPILRHEDQGKPFPTYKLF